jgi:hypothetical protein
MGRQKTKPLDDDDYDDAPRRVGRPRTPEPHGPPKPEAHDRREYRDRLQAILDAVEVADLDTDARRYLQRQLRIHDMLQSQDPRRFSTRGEETVILILRVIAESSNGTAALTPPILRAVNINMHAPWVAQGLRLIEAYDAIDLVALHAQLCDLGLDDQLERALRTKLTAILGPPVSPAKPEPKLKRGRWTRPPGISQEVWAAIVAKRRVRRNALSRKRYAANPRPRKRDQQPAAGQMMAA